MLSNFDPPLRVYGPGMPTYAPRTSDNIAPVTNIEAIKRIPNVLQKENNAKETLRNQKFCLDHPAKNLLRIQKKKKQVE